MARLLTVLSLLLCAFMDAQGSPTNSLAFTHATVIDVVSGKLKSDQVVLVTGERIVAVGKTGKVKLPQDAQVVDATDKFLIPGLWDMHVHGTGYGIPSELYIANGVTGVRGMFGEMPAIQAERKAIREGKAGPRIVAAGRILDGPKPIWPGSIAIKDAEEGRKAVQTAKSEGSDFIKVYELLPRDAYFAIAAEAKRQGMVFAGHVPQAVTAAEASDAGQKSIEHLTGVIRGCSTRESEVVSSTGKQRLSDEATSVRESYDEKKAQALFARFKRNHTWQCPTLTILYNLGHLGDTNVTDDPRLKYASAELKDFWNSRKPHSTNGPSEWSLMMQKSYRKDVELVGKMRRVGVEFLAGTDVCNPYCFPGSVCTMNWRGWLKRG